MNRLLRGAFLVVFATGLLGCGGSAGQKSAAPPAPAAGSGGVVAPEVTRGLVGPATRASLEGSVSIERARRIPGSATRLPRKNGHAVAGAADCHGDVMPAADNIDQLNAAILCLVNVMRDENGHVPPLQASTQLRQAADGMATRMVDEKFFSHETPDGKNVVDRIEPTGYIPSSGDWVVGENLAWGSGALSTPQAIVNGWMNSPGHRANILAPDYKDIGLAVAIGSPTPDQSGGATYVNEFGSRTGADRAFTLPAENGAKPATAGVAALGQRQASPLNGARVARVAGRRSEYVRIANRSARTISFRGVTLRNSRGVRARFPGGFRLRPHRTAVVRLGCAPGRRRGSFRGTRVWLCRRGQLFADRGDLARLADRRGVVVSQRGFGSLKGRAAY